VEIDTYSLSFVFIKSTNGNTKMNLRKWLSKTKETITTTLDTVVLFTANNNSNSNNSNSNNSNNKKLSEKQQDEKTNFSKILLVMTISKDYLEWL
jgi:delta-aminolevulinic acid dehydratase/porphobilinogen synthase